MELVRKLNPGLRDPDVLAEGQEIRVPDNRKNVHELEVVAEIDPTPGELTKAGAECFASSCVAIDATEPWVGATGISGA